MTRHRAIGLTLVLTALLTSTVLTATGCAPPPPSLSPAGRAAFQATRVVKALDVLRDTAIAANAERPPILSEASTRKVVVYHRSAVLVIGRAPAGWATIVGTGLDQLASDLPPPERQQLAPYINLLKAVLAEVNKP